MVIPKGGLLSPSHQSSYSFRGMDDLETVKTGRSITSGSSRQRKERSRLSLDDRSKSSAEYRDASSSLRRSQSMSRIPSVVSSTSSRSVRQQRDDEGLIQKLITEGLWSVDAKTIEDVLNKISNLMFTADEELKTHRRDSIYRAGGHLAIVQAMKRHLKNKGVQTQGCRALANATWETSDFMNAITAVGGIDVIISAMIQFPNDEVVQICGCCALRNLSSMRKIAKMIVDKDGLPVAVQAMQTFPMNANIQECVCWTIAHLCLDKENKQYIQRVKCFAAIGSAADNHSRQPEVLLAARQATDRMWEILI